MREKVSKWLAILFVVAIVGVMAGTIAVHGRNFAYGFFKGYKDQLPDDPDIFDSISARIDRLDYNASRRIVGLDVLRHLSARTQILPPKVMVNVSTEMARLSTGGWINVVAERFTPEKVNDIISFAKEMEEEYAVPTAVIYCHPALYEEGIQPGDLDVYNQCNSYADSLTEILRENGLSVWDSRDTYTGHALTMDEAVNKSDVHWTHLMALYTAYDGAEYISRQLGLDLDWEKLDPGLFSREMYRNLLFGEFARRLGRSLVTLDDVYLLYPQYETHLTYERFDEEDEVFREGSFRETVIESEKLEKEGKHDYSENAYYVYGSNLAQVHTYNEAAPDTTVLVFKDSFGQPISMFMSLAARDVYSVDMRDADHDMKYYVEKIRPDVVIIAYCQQSFRNIEVEIEGN
ncbi:MAG: hypothetical protein K5663_02180 [Clostridiales bacterium]|nr:hypothetical protein [Clostridiales bacterium]